MERKELYISPELLVIEFVDNLDIVTASGDGDNDVWNDDIFD